MATETATGRAPKEAQVETRDVDEFSALLKQSFKPRTERAATEVENAVKTLVEQALADASVIKSDVLDTIEEMIAQLDKKLSAQMNEIMHAPEFQQIESAWRGLKYLVFQSETDAMLKIRVMNVSKSELYRHLRQFPLRGHFLPLQPLEFPDQRLVLGHPQSDPRFPLALFLQRHGDEVAVAALEAECAPLNPRRRTELDGLLPVTERSASASRYKRVTLVSLRQAGLQAAPSLNAWD